MPKNGFGTIWFSADPSERYCGSSWLRFRPPSVLVCRSCPSVPTYATSAATRHGSSRCTVTFHCRFHGVGLPSRSGAWIDPPAAVSRPSADAGRRTEPGGIGIAQQPERGDAVDRRHPQVLGPEPERPDRAVGLLIRRAVDVRVAGAQHGLVVHLERAADARRDVVGVGLELPAADAVHADEHEAAAQVGKLRDLAGERRSRRPDRSSSSDRTARSAASRSRSAGRGSASAGSFTRQSSCT